MKDTVRTLGTALCLVLALSVAASADPASLGKVTAKAGILIDAKTGDVIWQRNPDLPLPPASTTKVMTALVALRSARLNDSLIVSQEAAQTPPSKINLKPGWHVQLRDLIYALMLNSANDAAEVVAEGVAGSTDAFAQRMNRQARALGAVNSHFVNPHGLPADGHVSTARDLTTIFKAALREPLFRQAVGTKSTVIHPTSGSNRRIVLHNHNRLLDNYKVQVVGKTGWTRAAKKCFVGAAITVDGHEILVSVLGSRNLWGDLTRLLNYGLASEREPELPVQMVQNDDSSEEPLQAAAGDSDDDPPPPEPHRVRAAAKEFAVQLATFADRQRAERLRSDARRKGYSADINPISKGAATMYRVTIPGFRSHRQAQTAGAKLRKLHRDLRPIVTLADG